jgi:hypothetical protein
MTEAERRINQRELDAFKKQAMVLDSKLPGLVGHTNLATHQN